MELVERALSGDRLALSRLLTAIENQTEEGLLAVDEFYPRGGGAHIVGLTGGTGTGKSTLANQLAAQLRSASGPQPAAPRVAIVAVDPTSPFSGGAILGDRIRMRDLSGDEGIFIRSMASRGALGGLALRTRPVVQALDAAGYSPIIIETVGAGQSEVEIARTAHTTIVVEAPGLGDDVQAIKAGILEAADILVVNKADLPGAERAASYLRAALRTKDELGSSEGSWDVPMIMTVASEGTGIGELAQAIQDHAAHLHSSGQWDKRHRLQVEAEMRLLIKEQLAQRFLAGQSERRFEELVAEVDARRLSPRQAVAQLTMAVQT